MSGKQISLVYFYLISAASLALIVVGIFSTVNFAVNITQYNKYPVPQYEENCDYLSRPMPDDKEATLTAEEKDQQKKDCDERVERSRKQHQVDDLKSAITFSIVGLVLFGIHFPLARKHSK